MVWECDWCGKQFKREPRKPCATCEKEEKGQGKVFNYHGATRFIFKGKKLVFDKVDDY